VKIRRHLRRTLGIARDFVVGRPELSVIDRLARDDRRTPVFAAALEFVNYEKVDGDIVEFGVFAGASLALLSRCHEDDTKEMARRVVGFDSFDGLPVSAEQHARWRPGACSTMHARHPLVAVGARVTPQVTRDLFAACELPAPELHVGLFEDTVPRVIPSKYPAIAVAHIDCDLYESTRTVLHAVVPALQDGTILLFDDWFHYRGDPNKGEARAYSEFLACHPEWQSVHYRTYATFCNAFILSRR